MAKVIIFKLQIQEPERSREVTLKQGVSTLGREPGNDIQLNYPKVSRKHARIECTDTMCMIFDEESANGTLVDGQRIPPNVPIPLHDNSVVEIDPVRIVCKHTVDEVPDEPTAPEITEPEERKQDTVSRQAAIKKEEVTVEQIQKEPEKAEKEEPEPPEQKEEKKEAAKEKPPQEPPVNPPLPDIDIPEPEKEWAPPPGLSVESIRYLDYLPSIYHTEFMSHFMALFESILMPVEWNVDNFDLYLQPGTVPVHFMQWLSNWYELTFDSSWSEEKRRLLLKEAHQIYARRGTCWALSRILEIYTGQIPEILEFEKDMEPHTFKVVLNKSKEIDQELVIRLIDASKPAHTSYQLVFRK